MFYVVHFIGGTPLIIFLSEKINLWTLLHQFERFWGNLPSSCRPVPLCPPPAEHFSLSPAAVSHRWPRPFPLLRRPSSPAVIIAARCHIPGSPLCLLEVTGLIRRNDIPDMMEKLGSNWTKGTKVAIRKQHDCQGITNIKLNNASY